MNRLRTHFYMTIALLLAASPVAADPSACGFREAFVQPDIGHAGHVPVYEASADPKIGGAKALAFVNSLYVNTDGTRISYKVDDPHAEHGAINDIGNALRCKHCDAEFEKIAAAHWMPLDQTWKILSSSVIERDQRPATKGLPCVDKDNYLISATADVSVAGGYAREGDCDASKWIDALTVDALVLPSRAPGAPPTPFEARKAMTRSVAIAVTLVGPRRLSYGIVGDTGPANNLGEASVAMNRTLNGLAPSEIPTTQKDAETRFQGPRSLVLVFPMPANRLPYPVNHDTVEAFAKARFEAWGGEVRLATCLTEIPGAQ